jgi:adenylate cyclase class 2
MIEVERKFRLSEQQKRTVENKLRERNSEAVSVRQSDKVFLRGIDSFAGFTQGEPIMRLRTENNITTLTYKRRINDAGDSVEHELVIGNADTMQAILVEMNYRLVTKVEKDRLEVKKDLMTLALDAVDDLGSFLEIEILAEDAENVAELDQQIMVVAKEFGLTAVDIEPKKYDQMIAALQSEGSQ